MVWSKTEKMVFNGQKLEYSLEGNSNYVAWKYHMEAVLEDNWLNEFIDNYFLKLATSDAKDLAEWKKCVAKVSRIILEGI